VGRTQERALVGEDRVGVVVRGGALPGLIGADLERDVEAALGRLPHVVVWRNDVKEVETTRGGRVKTGIGDFGAPDLVCEVLTPGGLWACVWLECKAGSGRLARKQPAWHAAAAARGRHAYVVKSVEHALAIVESFRGGVAWRE
jgi:hypothetical protein